jgi:hypothetical protein
MKTVSDIRPIKEGQESALLKGSGVTGVDIGYKFVDGKKTDELSIRVYVEEKKAPSAVAKKDLIPKTIKGVKTDVIQRKFVLHPRLMRVADMKIKEDTGLYDPLRGGMSIGPCRSVYLNAAEAACHGAPGPGYYRFVGTLGCIVLDNDTNAEMLLSNFHVMCVDDGWQVGDLMCQPSRVDGGSCPTDVVGSLQRAALTNQVDAAIASHTARSHQCSILDIGDVTGTAAATVGMAVPKRGRTTMLTYGNVDTIDLSVNINYCNGLGLRTLVHQIGIEPDPAQNASFGEGGDSGSVVVDASGKVVGLYFAGDDAGYGVANPIDNVLAELNVHVCVSKPWDIKKLEKDFDIKKQEHEIKKQEQDIKKQEKEHDIKKQEQDIKKQEKEHEIKKQEQDIKKQEKEHEIKKQEQDIKKQEKEHEIKKQEQDIKKQEKEHEIKKQEQDIKKQEKEHEIKKQEQDIKKQEKEHEIHKGVGEPITPGPVAEQPPTPGAGQTPSFNLEERLARLEAALAQLTHFIQPESRPNIDKAALQNESDVGRR